MTGPEKKQPQPNNPLHGVTLEAILKHLSDKHGWQAMADYVPIRCFQYEPSITSSLKFLRKTLWAKERVEHMYVQSINNRLRESRRP